MRTRLLGTVAIAALALTACGGDDDNGDGGLGLGDGGGGSSQDQVADMMIEVLNDTMQIDGVDGVEIDEDCIRDQLRELSDSDARAILEAGPEGDPEVSDQAELVGEGMFECIDMSGIDLGDIDIDE